LAAKHYRLFVDDFNDFETYWRLKGEIFQKKHDMDNRKSKLETTEGSLVHFPKFNRLWLTND